MEVWPFTLHPQASHHGSSVGQPSAPKPGENHVHSDLGHGEEQETLGQCPAD